MIRRRLEKFTDWSSTNAIFFVEPTALNVEWESHQPLRNPRNEVVGAGYAVDQLGSSAGIKGIATETLRFNLIQDDVPAFNTMLDAFRSRPYQNAAGKLWQISGENERRWCRARIVGVPEILLGQLNITWGPVVVQFERYSDWYAEDETVVEEPVSSTPHNFGVDNAGNTPVRNAVIELRAGGVNGFQALTIESLSTGDSFSSTRAAQGGNSRLRIDCGRHAVEYSNDGGVTWTADRANFSYGPKQVDFLRLEAGLNTLRYSQTTGTPNLSMYVRFYAAWN